MARGQAEPRLVLVAHEVEAGEPRADVEAREAERVVVVPQRSGLLVVRVLVDFLRKGGAEIVDGLCLSEGPRPTLAMMRSLHTALRAPVWSASVTRIVTGQSPADPLQRGPAHRSVRDPRRSSRARSQTPREAQSARKHPGKLEQPRSADPKSNLNCRPLGVSITMRQVMAVLSKVYGISTKSFTTL